MFPEDWATSLMASDIFQGMTWACIVYHQANFTEGVGRVYSNRNPTVEFLVDGIQDEVPAVGATDTVKSDKVTRRLGQNLADFAWWYLAKHTTVGEERLDYDSYKAAYNLMATGITPPDDAPDRYKPMYFRGHADGMFESTDNINRILEEINFAWNGGIAEVGGTIHLRPGSDAPIVRTIPLGEVIEEPSTKYGPTLEERANATTMRLSEASDVGYREYDLGEHIDTQALARDGGEKLVVDLGTRAFINRAVAAHYCQVVDARIRREALEIVARVIPGDAFENHKVLPFDRVAYTNLQGNVVNEKFIVLRRVMEPDWSMTFTLLKAPDGRFDRDHELPYLPTYEDIPVAGVIPTPNLPTVRKRVVPKGEGDVAVFVTFDFENEDWDHILQIWDMDSDGNLINSLFYREIREPLVIFEAPAEDTYLYRLWLLGNDGRRSETPAQGTFDVSYDLDNLPGSLILVRAQVVLGFIQFIVQGIKDRRAEGVELRYTRVGTDSTVSPMDIDTEAKWAAAPRMAVEPIIPEYGNSNEHSLIEAFVPEDGLYKIYGRIITKQGLTNPDRQGPISALGEYTLARTTASGGIPPTVPTPLDWEGVSNRMGVLEVLPQHILVYDPDNPRTMRYTEWNGNEGWAFGRVGTRTPPPSFRQNWIVLQKAQAVRVRIRGTLFAATGAGFRNASATLSFVWKPSATGVQTKVQASVLASTHTGEFVTPWVNINENVKEIAALIELNNQWTGFGLTAFALESES